MYSIMIQIDAETKKKAFEDFFAISAEISKGKTKNIKIGKSNDNKKKKKWTPYNYVFMGHRNDIKYTSSEE